MRPFRTAFITSQFSYSPLLYPSFFFSYGGSDSTPLERPFHLLYIVYKGLISIGIYFLGV